MSFQPFFKGWNGQGVVSAFFKGWNGVSFQTCFQGENEHWQNKESLDLHVFALKTRTECKPDQNIFARNAFFFRPKNTYKMKVPFTVFYDFRSVLGARARGGALSLRSSDRFVRARRTGSADKLGRFAASPFNASAACRRPG